MRTVAIVQARMGSSRLPGKVLCDIAGETMLARVVGRLRQAYAIDAVVIATTTGAEDDPIVAHAEQLGVASHRGDRDDVLARYLGAARAANAERIVRVTSDCPLLDPCVVDRVVDALTADIDYASNTQVRTFPRGLDVEAVQRDTLERLARMAHTHATREHVTSFITEHPAWFRIAHVLAPNDDSDLRWTVDTPDDLALVRALYEQLDAGGRRYHAIVGALRGRPELVALNAHVAQRSWLAHA